MYCDEKVSIYNYGVSLINKLNRYNKITLDELENIYKVNTYNELRNIVLSLINDKKIKIIEASGRKIFY